MKDLKFRVLIFLTSGLQVANKGLRSAENGSVVLTRQNGGERREGKGWVVTDGKRSLRVEIT